MSPATPNWVVASLRPEMSREIAQALLRLEPGSMLARSALGHSNFVGFQEIKADSLHFPRAAVRAGRAR
jgi:hypothetical protein